MENAVNKQDEYIYIWRREYRLFCLYLYIKEKIATLCWHF